MNNQIQKLPDVLIDIIKEYLPKIDFVFTNRENYQLYHYSIKPYILDHNMYVRDVIKRDNEYVFDIIVRENYLYWLKISSFNYKNFSYKNYLYFILAYCQENDSYNCLKLFNLFLTKHGLNTELIKKCIVRRIKIYPTNNYY